MALQEKINPLTVEASADLSASQFRFVSVDSSGQLAVTGAGALTLGVLQDKPAAAGRASEVGLLNGSGRLKVTAGGTVAAGDKVMSDATGRAIVATLANHVNGMALKAAVVGDLIEISPQSSYLDRIV